MTRATLEIRVRANASVPTNDTLQLQVNNAGSAFLWARRIGTTGGVPGLLPTAWNTGNTQTFCLDLAALPNVTGPTTNLIQSLNATGRLDIFVQDDTSVDYAILRIRQCPKMFIRGDCDGDGVFNCLADAIFALSCGFLPGSPCPPCVPGALEILGNVAGFGIVAQQAAGGNVTENHRLAVPDRALGGAAVRTGHQFKIPGHGRILLTFPDFLGESGDSI